jgi:lipopolysaccharide biosynthesis regulator YciM
VNLGQFLLLVVILGAILAFIGIPWWMARRREEAVWDPSQAYLSAIDGLVRGEPHAALEPLRELAKRDAENIGVFLRLGDLVRRMGYPERSYRIHADLLARPITRPEDERRIHQSLLEDLMELDRPEERGRIAEKLLSLDHKNPVALRAMIRAHEERGDWQKACDLLDEWYAVDPAHTRPTPAQMRIHVARLHLAAGRTREARKLLDEALKMPLDGPVARVFLGDLLVQEGEVDRACEQWMQYLREYSDRSDLVFARLERAYFEMGRFGDLVSVYESLAAGRSANPHAAVALADMHRRRGRLDEAVRQLETVLEHTPDHQLGRRQLIGSLLQIGRTEHALRELDTLLGQVTEGASGVACNVCGKAGGDLWIRCERCGSWQEPLHPAPPAGPRSSLVRPAD